MYIYVTSEDIIIDEVWISNYSTLEIEKEIVALHEKYGDVTVFTSKKRIFQSEPCQEQVQA
jgi:hypothetical protein